MASYLSASQKSSISAVFDNMHDTFARTITIYQVDTKIFVSTSSTYNALYKRLKDSAQQRTEVTSTTAKARILYVDKQLEKDLAGVSAQIKVPLSEGMVRVKIDASTYALFKKATQIEIDGTRFNIVSDDAGIGQFNITYYTVYLQRAA